MTCKRFDVVIVPFPFTDRRASKRRPALALSTAAFSERTGNTVLAMITSAKNSDWAYDTLINAKQAGLSSPSKVRMKLFTLDNRLILRAVGVLGETDRSVIIETLQRLFLS